MFFGLNPQILDMNDTRIVTYDAGRVYTIKPFAGRDTTKIFAKLVKYGSGAFGGVLRGLYDKEEEEELNAVSYFIAGALQDAFVDIDDPKFIDFITTELLANVYRNNSPIDYDKEFAGQLLLAFDLMRHVIDYNFRPVFQQLGINALLKVKAQTE